MTRLRSTPYHTSALDGLRGAAILCVLLAHAGLPLFGGSLIMFTLSGYLITSRLMDECEETGTINTGAFYARRVRRLWPALLVMVIGVNVWVGLSQPAQGVTLVIETLYALVGMSNWAQIWHAPQTAIFAHLWSLSIEMQFYLVWPVGVLLLRSRRRVLWVSLTVAAASWLIRALAVTSDAPIGVLYVTTYTRLDGLFIGCALAAALSPLHLTRLASWSQRSHLPPVIQAAAVAVMMTCLLAYPLYEPMTYIVSLPLVAGGTALLITGCVLPHETWIARGLSQRWSVALGKISYGVYLWHWPLKMLMHDALPGEAGIIGGIGGVILGVLSYRWIEAPLMKTRPQGHNIKSPPG